MNRSLVDGWAWLIYHPAGKNPSLLEDRMSVACPRVVPDRSPTLRQWIGIQRARGDLGT